MSTPLLVTRDGSLPDSPEPLLVESPRSWAPGRLDSLRRHAEHGGIVVVVDPPQEAGWEDLLGVDVMPAGRAFEVVLEATPHPAARNLPAESVIEARLPTLLPRPGTDTVLRTRLHLDVQAAVTARPCGQGLLVASVQGATAPTTGPGRGSALRDPISKVLERLWRGVATADAVVGSDLGIGIVGYGQHGGMGWLHGTAAAATDGLRLVAVAEPHPARRADAAARFPEIEAHDDVEGLLADDGVAVVVIATPPSTHHDLAMRALEAGKHVVVEKPLCFTAAEADQLLARAADARRLLTVHQNRRWDSDFRAVQRLLAEGRLGEVFNVETFVGGFEHPCTLWHSDTGVSGGRLYDWGAHLIDQILLLLGGAAPVEVTATGHDRVWHDVTNLDQVRVRMRFADGREAEFLDSDVLAVRRPKYVVQGTRGTLVGRYAPVVEERVTPDRGYERDEHHHAEGPARLTLAAHAVGWGLQEVAVPGLRAPAHPFHRALADHLQLGDPMPVDPAEIRVVTAVLEAATTSASEGSRPVRPA